MHFKRNRVHSQIFHMANSCLQKKHQQIEFNFWKSEFFTGITWMIRLKSIWYEVSPAKKGFTFSEVTFKNPPKKFKGAIRFFFREKKNEDLPSKPGEIVFSFFSLQSVSRGSRWLETWQSISWAPLTVFLFCSQSSTDLPYLSWSDSSMRKRIKKSGVDGRWVIGIL